jgi:uncharacterized protein (TIGR02996 family)
MDPHEPFLNAILADRHNDLPRLVYADWLEENGEPTDVARAHFIRTQIHLETTDPRSELHAEMKALEARILDWYLDEWRHELPEPLWYSDALQQVRWRRGFPDDLGPMDEDEFGRYGRPALDTIPLTSLHLQDRHWRLNFAEVPGLRHVVRLKLGPRFGDLTATSFDLPIDTPEPDSTSTESLLFATVFTALRHLDLSENALTDAWVIRFATSFATTSFARTLETLNLSGNFGITNAGANVLATAPGLSNLNRLFVTDTGITSSGMNMLRKRFGERLRSTSL